MYTVNEPSRIEVSVFYMGPAEWWQIVGALAPLLVLAIFAAIFLMALRRETPEGGAEERADWWSRAEWALDMALDSKPEKRRIGLAVLEHLSASGTAHEEDARIIAQAKARLRRP